MWTSTKQACDTIRGLLRRVRLDNLWTDEGPTQEAVQLLKDKGGPLSTSETLMLQVAFDLWSSSGHAPLDKLLGVFDGGNLRAVLDAIAIVRPDVGRALR